MEIRQVDLDDDADLKVWYDVYLEADTHQRPFVTPWRFEEVVVNVRADTGTHDRVGYLGTVDGEPVASMYSQRPLRDNLRSSTFLLHVLPEHRRRGYATQMVERLFADLVPLGRTVLQTNVDFAYDRGPSGTGEPGVEFLRRHGFTLGLVDVQRAVRLPIDEAVLDALIAGAAAHHEGYRLVEFVDRCPDELVESFARLMAIFVDEIPAGEMTFEAEAYDVDRVRSGEKALKDAQRVGYYVLAVAPDGEVVGFTQLVVPRHDPGKVFQWGTLVDPRHRGHRLGTALKAANHRLLQRHETGSATCYTYNAEVNEHMIAVNELLGYHPTARSGEFEKRLT
jgi:GNAT superfamily N-acetyltransferase